MPSRRIMSGSVTHHSSRFTPFQDERIFESEALM